MKKLIILISIFLCGSVVAQAQADPFDKLMDMKGMTTVYISKAMLGMMSDMDPKSMSTLVEGVDIGEITKKLTSITVLTSEKPEAIKALNQLASDLKKNKAYEPLMFAKTDETSASFYAKVGSAKSNEETEMIIVVNEGADKGAVLVKFTGSMTLADIQKIAASKK